MCFKIGDICSTAGNRRMYCKIGGTCSTAGDRAVLCDREYVLYNRG